MNFNSLTSRLIETGPQHLGGQVSSLCSIDARDAVKYDGGFSVIPGRHVTLAQLNPVGYIGDAGLASENPVFSVRFHLDNNSVTSVMLARTRARVDTVFRMDDTTEAEIDRAEDFLTGPHGSQIEEFARGAREYLTIPPVVMAKHQTIARIIRIEEALNMIYTRVILLYFVQKKIEQVRAGPGSENTIGRCWPKVGSGEIFQATAPLRRKVSNLNLRILDTFFDKKNQ